jgi:hypothetical protein
MTPPCVISVLAPVENVGAVAVDGIATVQSQLSCSSGLEHALVEEEAHVSVLLSVAARIAPHLLGSSGVKSSRTSGIYEYILHVSRVFWGYSLICERYI